MYVICLSVCKGEIIMMSVKIPFSKNILVNNAEQHEINLNTLILDISILLYQGREKNWAN